MTRARLKPSSNTNVKMKLAPKLARKGYKKQKIHAALREQVWLGYAGPQFQTKCATRWCQNEINCFNFQCGHIQAESLGGVTTLENLTPLCSRCNQSMGTMHMDAWNAKSQPGQISKSFWSRFKNFFRRRK